MVSYFEATRSTPNETQPEILPALSVNYSKSESLAQSNRLFEVIDIGCCCTNTSSYKLCNTLKIQMILIAYLHNASKCANRDLLNYYTSYGTCTKSHRNYIAIQ